MKAMKQIISIVVIIGICFVSHRQNVVSWNFSTKKIADRTYEIHLTPSIQAPWHIYSQQSPESGAMPTKFSFNKNPLVIIDEETREIGKVVSKYEEVFEVTVKYFEGKVNFVQTVKLKTNVKTNITGTIEYMACNDEQCLPPQTINFNIKLE